MATAKKPVVTLSVTEVTVPGVLTLEEAAEYLGVSKRQLNEYKSRGLLVISYLGGSHMEPRIYARDLAAFLENSWGSKALSARRQSNAKTKSASSTSKRGAKKSKDE